MVETTVSGFEDEFPRQLHGRKTLFTAAICTLFFLLGIPCVTQVIHRGYQNFGMNTHTFSFFVLKAFKNDNQMPLMFLKYN